MSDETYTRIAVWLLGLGGTVAGGLLVWIGSQTFQLAQSQVQVATELRHMNQQIERNGRTLESHGDKIDRLTARVAALEHTNSGP